MPPQDPDAFIPGFDLEQQLAQAQQQGLLPGLDQAANQDPFVGPGNTDLPGDAYVRGLVTDPYANEPLDQGEGPYNVGYPGESADRNLRGTRRVEHPGGEMAFATTHPFQYRQSDVATTLFDMSPAEVLRLQARLVEAGLMNKMTGNPGDSITAMRDVMGMANIHGMNWQDALTMQVSQAALINDGLKEGSTVTARREAVFTYDTYLPPDYDTLATNIEGLFREHLGREPEPHELTILADKMSALYRSDFDAQYQAALQKFEAHEFANTQADMGQAVRARDGDDPLVDPAPGNLVNPPETGPEQVDVGSSTYQFFKQRYAAELDRVDQMRQLMANRQVTAGALLGLGNTVGSGPVNEL